MPSRNFRLANLFRLRPARGMLESIIVFIRYRRRQQALGQGDRVVCVCVGGAKYVCSSVPNHFREIRPCLMEHTLCVHKGSLMTLSFGKASKTENSVWTTIRATLNWQNFVHVSPVCACVCVCVTPVSLPSSSYSRLRMSFQAAPASDPAHSPKWAALL